MVRLMVFASGALLVLHSVLLYAGALGSAEQGSGALRKRSSPLKCT